MASLIAAVFPGQGSQALLMGKDILENFPKTASFFEEAEDILSVHLKKIMFEGPEASLQETIYAQPALFLVSSVLVFLLKTEFGIPIQRFSFVAGHSLGEYSALYAAEVLSFSSALALIARRAKAMHQMKEGAMLAVLGLPCEDIEKIVERYLTDNHLDLSLCTVANENSPAQTILSGSKMHLETISEKLMSEGALRCIFLKVSGAFHSPFMQKAQDEFAPYCEAESFHFPCVPVVTNYSGQPQNDPVVLKKHLMKQITGRVLWHQTQKFLEHQKIEKIYEIGSGSVLAGLARKTIPSVLVDVIQDRQSLQNAAKQISL